MLFIAQSTQLLTHPPTQGQVTGKRNTIHKQPEAKYTTEPLIKLTGNTECTVANTTQGKLCKTQKKKRHKNKKAKEGKSTHR
jgi:hypothetical protein